MWTLFLLINPIAVKYASVNHAMNGYIYTDGNVPQTHQFKLVSHAWNCGWSRDSLWCPSITGPRFNIKIWSYQYRKSHCGDKTVLSSSHLHNGISYTGKTTSLYWIRALVTLHWWLLIPGCSDVYSFVLCGNSCNMLKHTQSRPDLLLLTGWNKTLTILLFSLMETWIL